MVSILIAVICFVLIIAIIGLPRHVEDSLHGAQGKVKKVWSNVTGSKKFMIYKVKFKKGTYKVKCHVTYAESYKVGDIFIFDKNEMQI